jgi:hypothetical protein
MAGCRTGGLSGNLQCGAAVRRRSKGWRLIVVDDLGLSVITGRRVRKRWRLCDL